MTLKIHTRLRRVVRTFDRYMPTLTKQKELLEVTTRALGLGLVLVYIIGLLITNVYFSVFGISDFSMLRVRYLTTGFAFLSFSLLPLIILLVPIFAFYYLRGRHRIISVPASLLAFLIVVFTGYMVLLFVVNERTVTAPFFLYAVELPTGAVGYNETLKILFTWFTPIALVLFVYAPLCAMFITWRVGRWQKAGLVVCIPLVLFGMGSVLTRFAGGHYPQLRPAFGGPTATIADVLVAAPACGLLGGVDLVSDDGVCALKGITLLHETDKRIYVRQPGHDGLVLQIPLTQVKLITAIRGQPL